MENEKQEINDSPETPVTEVAGPMTDQMVQERLAAVAKAANTPKRSRLKSRHTVEVTETVKVATAFGATNKEITVIKEVVPEIPKTEEEKKAALEEELEHQLKQKLGHAAVPVPQEKLDKAKEIRNALSSLWSTNLSQTSSVDDKFIEGVPGDSGSAVVNTEAGQNDVRISFKSKK